MTTMVTHKAQYGVKFVGYSAWIIARKHGREVEYATLDLITGYASVNGNCGRVNSQRADLGPLVRSLPDLKNELEVLLSQHPAHGGKRQQYDHRVSWPKHHLGCGWHGPEKVYSTSNQTILRD